MSDEENTNDWTKNGRGNKTQSGFWINWDLCDADRKANFVARQKGQDELCSDMEKSARIFYTNANGLINKMDELKLRLSVSNVDIICITETHLSEEITDAELQIEGYSFHRGDRKFNLHTEVINEDISEGGGSIIYFRNHIIILMHNEI